MGCATGLKVTEIFEFELLVSSFRLRSYSVLGVSSFVSSCPNELLDFGLSSDWVPCLGGFLGVTMGGWGPFLASISVFVRCLCEGPARSGWRVSTLAFFAGDPSLREFLDEET